MSRIKGWMSLPTDSLSTQYWRNRRTGKTIYLIKLDKKKNQLRYVTNIKGRFGDRYWKTREMALEHLLRYMRSNP